MSDNIDVVKELEKKNREIYLNKLYMDIDNNQEIILITVNNMFDLLEKELANKIMEIQSSSMSFSDVCKIIHPFQQKVNDNVVDLINKRSVFLKEYIVNNQKLDYLDKLEKENNTIITKVSKFYQNNVMQVVSKLVTDLDEFSRNRLIDYLKNLYFEKLINKLKEILDNTNRILYNNYLDGVSKYEKMNKKTINHV